ncbi:hypothetical protein M885DRAFT_510467 [Pelagophyceae sp. CCMP2097]|nr:hypothetical protein M885DRAFT_510467 [Pelagophyceae sp. CCMP2097]
MRLLGLTLVLGRCAGLLVRAPGRRLSALRGRPSSEGIALELRTIKEHSDVVRAHLTARRAGDDALASVDRLAALYDDRSALTKVRDAALAARKTLSGRVGALLKDGADAAGADVAALKAEVAAASDDAAAAEARLEAVETESSLLFTRLPNLLDDAVPDGAGESDNVVVSEWGTEKRKLGEGAWRWHDDLAASLGGYDVDAAAKLSGARFSVLRGGVAALERALGNFFLDVHTRGGAYEEASVPLIVGRSALEGTGQLPKFEDDLFAIKNFAANGEDAFLIPTAEVPLTNLVAGKLLEEADLPINLAAWTSCFRAEAGSYGRDTRGLIRQHQFGKVELVKITAPSEARRAHAALVADAEAVLRLLDLPYRKVLLCSGDIGFSAQLCYDLEVWLPGQQAWREISSCSLMGDFQARRMGLRYRPAAIPGAKVDKKNKAKPVPPCTMNGSGLAVGRALVAVLENHQRPDGSVDVPAALIPYMGGRTRLSQENAAQRPRRY